jgi:hypothetical protein
VEIRRCSGTKSRVWEIWWGRSWEETLQEGTTGTGEVAADVPPEGQQPEDGFLLLLFVASSLVEEAAGERGESGGGGINGGFWEEEEHGEVQPTDNGDGEEEEEEAAANANDGGIAGFDGVGIWGITNGAGGHCWLLRRPLPLLPLFSAKT